MNEIKLRPRLSWRMLRPSWGDVGRAALSLAWTAVLIWMGYAMGSGEAQFWMENAIQCWERK